MTLPNKGGKATKEEKRVMAITTRCLLHTFNHFSYLFLSALHKMVFKNSDILKIEIKYKEDCGHRPFARYFAAKYIAMMEELKQL